MPSSKAATSLPKAWPRDIIYLRRPTYSKKLCVDKLKALVSEASPTRDVKSYKCSGPYLNVKILEISQESHPANGQRGLFANQHLLPDSFVLPYLGYVHDQTDIDETSDYDLSLERELGVGVDATTMGNEARFINDYRGVSSAPNADFRDIFVQIDNGQLEKQIGIFVLSAGKCGKRSKGISRGQEILVSYGKGFWTERQAAGE